MLLWLISWVAVLGELSFTVFCLASGLYYLAELIEEYSILAKKAISISIGFVIVVDILLFLVEGFPLTLTVAGILCHVLYASLLRTFPEIKILSIGFLGGSVCLILSHLLSFQHFTEEYYSFQEVLGFFFLCLWTVPFALFISLSANDQVLPTLHPTHSGDEGVGRRYPRRSGFLSLFDLLSEKVTDITPSRSSKRI